ncbi:hypothetical protein HK098_005085 [Nowakowskiella sp. JEL0407]|nr:hypothetical protein HK098_005085 [Nowakowskiella sp. JEL0407]
MIEIVVTPELQTTPVSISQSNPETHHMESFPEFGVEPGKCSRVIAGTSVDNNFKVVQTIRPDDIWIAILMQFSRFVEANSEELRSKFVPHEGKKKLVINQAGDFSNADFAGFAMQISVLLKKNVVDETLYDWVMPNFTTTTVNDQIVGSVVFMASMKSYFTYGMRFLCGIPKIQILGEKRDWDEIRKRIKKLAEFGEICQQWAESLDSVLVNFCDAFDGKVDTAFWQRICCIFSGSGSSTVSGWITVFSAFSADGKWRGTGMPSMTLGKTIPGYVQVDLEIDDNGNKFEATMFAGHTGFTVHDDVYIAPKFNWAVALKNPE